MTWIYPQEIGTLLIGFGGVLLGLLGVLAAGAGKQKFLLARVLAIVASLIGLVGGVCLLPNTQASFLWWPTLAFLVLVVLAAVLPLPQVDCWGGRLVALLRSCRVQTVFWACVLVASPLGAMLLAYPEDDDLLAMPLTGRSSLADQCDNVLPLREVEHACATTDKGRPIKLFHLDNLTSPVLDPNLLIRQGEMLKNSGLSEQVIRISLGWQNCNCHGWVFTGGQFWVRADEVNLILQDNGYRLVERGIKKEPAGEYAKGRGPWGPYRKPGNWGTTRIDKGEAWFDEPLPHAGDVAIYRDANGAIVHSGLVRYVGPDSTILVESKWGRMGRFLHRHDGHCYEKASCSFYRSRRPGNILMGLPRPNGFPGSSGQVDSPPYFNNDNDPKNNFFLKLTQ